jgi:3-hydroxyisobutyrate dehydrogenase-like beta-hydroxyacid dehydrogenase
MVARRDATVMVGGDKEIFERSRDVLDAIGKKVFYIGPSGAGAQLKLIANHLVGTLTVALAEALSLGLKAGLDAELMLEVLRPSASGSRMMDIRGPLMARGDYEAQMKMEMFLKDFRLILGNGQSLGVPLPMVSIAQQVATAASSMGYGAKDLAAVMRVFEEMADIKR